jgi:hypothetical protein
VTERAPQHRRTTGRPPRGGDVHASDVSRDRLGAQLSTEVAATRAAWTDALLRSDAALREGDADRARRALDDQRVLLAQLQHRLDRAVSSALVEREAEQLLRDGGLQAVGGPTAPPTHVASGDDEPRVRRADRLPRALTGAAAAMVIGVVAMIVGTAPPPTPEITAMADTAPVVDAEPADVGPAWTTVESAPAPADELRNLAPVAPVPSEPADDPSPADAPAEPSPETGVEAPGDDDAPERSQDGLAAPESAPEPRADDEADGDEAPEEREEDADEETLTERLPALDRPISERLGQRIEGLLEP